MHLFQLGDFTLSSGARSSWKIDADALTDADIEALAEMIRLMVGPFASVEGVPRGGLRLAEALRKHCSLQGKLLIVDDVLTTGGSMETHRLNMDGGTPVVGAVIFARGQCPPWIQAVCQLPECFWLQKATR